MNEEESILGLLYKQMEDEKIAMSHSLLQGVARDFAQYRELCGKIYGISVAQSLINSMADKLRKQLE